MKINLLDPGLVRPWGHHHDWDTRIANALAGRGHEVCVYASVDAVPEALSGFADAVRVERHFRIHPYREPEDFDPLCGEIERQFVSRNWTARDLGQVAEADLWLWPTLFSYQLWACATVRPKAAISACIHMPPGQPSGAVHAEPDPWWRFAAKGARAAGLDLRTIGILDPEGLQASLPFLGDLDPFVLPIPIDGKPRRRTSLETVGFFGASRVEHGSPIVPDLIARCLDEGLKVTTQDTALLSPAIRGRPGLEILDPGGDFADKVARADLVVLPYQWGKYLGRISAVACQAIASGAPCVVPRGASFARATARIGSGSVFSPLNVETVFAAIARARQSFHALADAAYAGALEWQGTQGLTKFVDAMLGAAPAAA